ncbi:11917_t:CDS:2 [Funneliformis mosseae]|uniref:11917_t:CDS:1 n=1 Tax=Funneliformis mosseae TaxID=27381 RepID=A0A9N9AAK1_FUNMO|nr:11917_t:CDS:2 [Funneliformis mosseae]
MGEEKKSIKEYLGEKLDDILDTSEPIINTAGKLASATLSTIETSVPVIVPITKFFPLISEIGNVLNEIVEIVQAAEHNKRICDVLLQKVYAAELAVHDLKVRRNVHQGCFNTKNYLGLQSLCNVISQIKKFTGEVSQMKTMMKYLKGKSIEKTFKELCREFDSCVSLLSFTIAVKDRIDEAEQLRADQEELNKYIEEMGIEVKEIGADVKQVKTDVKEIGNDVKELATEITEIKQITKNYPDMVLKITAMHTTMEKLSKHSEPQSKIDNLFQVHNLNFEDYVQGDEKRDGGQVTKWTKKYQEFAFKVIGEAVSPDPDFRPKLSKMVNILGECNKEYVRLSHKFSPSSSNDSQSQPKIPTPKRTFSIDNDYEFAIKDEDLQDFDAAEDGLRVAMYNVGNLYYKGCNCKKDEAKAISYMKLAAYNEYNPAITFCKDHNIKL